MIELDSKNEKAWFRRGQACVRLKNFDEAKVSFTKVKEISGGKNKEVDKFFEEVEPSLTRSISSPSLIVNSSKSWAS